MKSIKRKTAVFLLVLVVLVPCIPTAIWGVLDPVYTIHEGSCTYGVSPLDVNCPLELKNTKLTFNINEFPKTDYASDEALLEYGGKLNARYEIYNPTDSAVTATLAFPLGSYPDYTNETYRSDLHLSQYSVAVDGEIPEITLRHTYLSSYSKYSKLLNGYKTGPLYAPNAKVTVYNYKVTDTEGVCYGVLKLPDEVHNDTRMIIAPGDYRSALDGLCFGAKIDEASGENSFSVYCVGEPYPETVETAVYKSEHTEERVKGTVTLDSTEVITLKELVMTHYSADSGISEVDWYNAVLDRVIADWKNGPLPADIRYLKLPERRVMRWYLYEVTVPARGTAVNEITSPIYPDINVSMDPYVYTYCHDTVPAEDWAGVGGMELEIITPYFITDSHADIQKTENGYAATRDGLLSYMKFRVSADPEPADLAVRRQNSMIGGFFAVVLIVMIIMAAIPVMAVVYIIVLIVKRIRKPRKE